MDRKTVVFITVIVALAAALFYFEHRQTLTLSQEVVQIRERLAASETARHKAEAGAKTYAVAADQLRSALVELPRLRGEVAGLKREIAEKNGALAKIDSEKSAQEREDQKPAITAFGSEVRDFGAATPERAATSLIWAATSGQKERLSELLELPAGIPDEETAKHYEYFANMLSNNFSRFQFTEIGSIKPNPDGTLRLGILYRDPETGRTNPFPFMLRKYDTGWKVVVEGAAPAKL
jgi:hypothetical protein